MAYIPQETIEEIQNRIDMLSLVGRYVQLTQRGSKHWGLSPFKAEKTPSFTVDPDKKLYYCFSTQQGGTVFTFVQKMENVGFLDAVHMLAKETGVEIKAKRGSDGNNTVEDTIKTKSLDILKKISVSFEYLLHEEENRSVLNYLTDRGIDIEVAKKFHLGYVPKDPYWVYGFLQEKGYSLEELANTGLFSKKNPRYCLFSRRLVFPIFQSSGQVVGFGGRLLEGDGPKYLNSPESHFFKKKQLLYGMSQALEQQGRLQKVYLVEGYFDVLAMHIAGMQNTVAPLGTAITLEQIKFLRRFTDSIVLVFDNDAAGRQAGIRAAMFCETFQFQSIRIVVLTENDPADILRSHGTAVLKDELLEEHDFFDYYINSLFPSQQVSQKEKEERLLGICRYLSCIPSGYRKEMYVSRVIEMFGVPRATLRSMIAHVPASSETARARGEDGPGFQEREADAKVVKTGELLVMVALCYNVGNYDVARRELQSEDLQDPNARKILVIMEKLYREGALNLPRILDELQGNLANMVLSLINGSEVSKYATSLVQEFIQKIKFLRYQRRNKEIDRLLAIQEQQITSHTQASSSHDQKSDGDGKALLEEKQFVIRELRKIKELQSSYNNYEKK